MPKPATLEADIHPSAARRPRQAAKGIFDDVIIDRRLGKSWTRSIFLGALATDFAFINVPLEHCSDERVINSE